VPIRGNVDTRLRKCETGVVDAVVLANAGMRRLGLEARVTHALDLEQCLPAVGQGALVIELCQGDSQLAGLLAPLDHSETALAVATERGLLEAVEGNCQVPVAGYAVREGVQLRLRGMLADPDGARLRCRELLAPWPQTSSVAREIGRQLGRQLLAADAD
jgi:hydroxymethylbilane synthase